jgi:ABC-type multidrug transport system fused ATPase/permease subunit
MNIIQPFLDSGYDYIKQFNPMEPALWKSLNPMQWNPFIKQESFEENEEDAADTELDTADTELDTAMKDATNTTKSLYDIIISIIISIIYYIFIIYLASFIANDLIFSHWTVRLFTFSFSLFLMYSSQFFLYPIAIYYVVYALRNAYLNFRDKPAIPLPLLPKHYATLPIMTSRGGTYDFLNPFSYFLKGEDMKDAKYFFYKSDEEVFKANANAVVPSFYELKKKSVFKFNELIKKFNTFIYEINQSFIVPTGGSVAKPSSKKTPDTEKEQIEQQIMGAIFQSVGPEKSKEYVIKQFGPTGMASPTGSTGTTGPTGASV